MKQKYRVPTIVIRAGLFVIIILNIGIYKYLAYSLFANLFLGAAFFVLVIWGFFEYKRQESKDKQVIYYYLSTGSTLGQAIEKIFSDLNKNTELGLRSSTITTVAEKIASLDKIMETDNVIEIYSTFVNRYIFRGRPQKKPLNLDDAKVLYAAENLEFYEKNGYFLIKIDADEDFDKKYPD